MYRLSLFLFCLTLAVPGFAEIRLTDFQQRQVVLERPAQRIVALAPHIVENTFSAGAGDKLVGVVSFSDYPIAAKDIPRIGDYKSWSLETIVALQPDLILIWGSGNGMNALSSLEKLGVPVYVSEPRRLQDIPDTIRAISKLAGTEMVGEAEAQRIEQAFDQLEKKFGKRKNLSVLYQVWNEPLQTLNGEHLISHAITLCGGKNIFADAVSLAPKISLESVLYRDPDLIVASGMGAARPDWPRAAALQHDRACRRPRSREGFARYREARFRAVVRMQSWLRTT
jgi:iron complex transport system substrate-binding protein